MKYEKYKDLYIQFLISEKNLSRISVNNYLVDLEQFFSFFNQDKISEKQNILLDDIEKNENLNSFFKKLNLNLSQKQIFFDNLNAFLLKESDTNFKKKIYNFFESFKE